MADDDHYFDDPAFADPDELNPCGDVYVGAGFAAFDCMKPKGHGGPHANTYGVGWDSESDDATHDQGGERG